MGHTTEQTTGNKSMNPMIVMVIVAVVLIGVGVVLAKGKSNSAPAQESTQMRQETSQPTSIQSTPMTADATGSMEVTGVEQAIEVEGGNFYFKPNEIRVKKGQPVTIILTSKGTMHDFLIDELNVASEQVPGGKSTTFTFTPDKTGTFEFYCSVGQHRTMGMVGKLIVE